MKTENPGCANLKLDESKYSSPIPLIGLYIAAGSSVCFLAILFDILSVFRHKKRWLPCRLFSLNSVTLALLAIAGKLPLDLTAAMPSTLDQFSKLSGMAFLCISMGFLMPSIGMNQKSECISNLIALTILVTTVIVNICIQIRTSLILLFVTEHIITMCCMVALLVALWTCFLSVDKSKINSSDDNRELLINGKGSMMEQLKLAYLYGYAKNPQFVLCKNNELYVVAGLCMLCSVVISQAAFRNLSLDFCRGKSDYGWSMWLIVVVQILTIAAGCFAICIRLLDLSVHVNPNLSRRVKSAFSHLVFDVFRHHPALNLSLQGWCRFVSYIILILVGIFLYIVIIIPLNMVLKLLKLMISPSIKNKYKDDEDIQEYKHLIHEDGMGLEEWVLVKSVKEMKIWIEKNRGHSPVHTIQLLSKPASFQFEDQPLDVVPLSLAVLARIAQVSLPFQLGESLAQVYNEVHEILHFIQDHTTSQTGQTRKTAQVAKALWRGNDFSCLVSPFDKRTANGGSSQSNSLDLALLVIQELKHVSPLDCIWEEVARIADYILLLECSSINDLYIQIQFVFVEMLRTILKKLPKALYYVVVERSAEEFDNGVKISLGVLCKVELLDEYISWSFPVETNISCLLTAPPHDSQRDIESLQQGGLVIYPPSRMS